MLSECAPLSAILVDNFVIKCVHTQILLSLISCDFSMDPNVEKIIIDSDTRCNELWSLMLKTYSDDLHLQILNKSNTTKLILPQDDGILQISKKPSTTKLLLPHYNGILQIENRTSPPRNNELINDRSYLVPIENYHPFSLVLLNVALTSTVMVARLFIIYQN